MDISQWRLDMIGMVAVAKPEGSWDVEFYPTEKLPMEDGDINVVKDITAVVRDLKGNTNTSAGQRKSKFPARWYPGGDDGRQTAPDVQPGEMIEIWRFGDSQRYFWRTYKNNPTLRRLEHVVHAYSNVREFGPAMNLESSYGSCFSTLNKVLSFWTSKSDGEAFKYTFQFNTKNSTFRVGDDVDNTFAINSEEDEVYMRNSIGSYLNLYGQYMSGYASRQICLKSDRIIKLLAPSVVIGGRGSCGHGPTKIEDWHPTTHVYANNDENYASIGNKYDAFTNFKGNDVSTTAKGTVSTEAPAVTTTTESHKVEATKAHEVTSPLSSFSDDVNVGKKLDVGDDARFKRDVYVDGDVEARRISAQTFSWGGRNLGQGMQEMEQLVQQLQQQVQQLESRVQALESAGGC